MKGLYVKIQNSDSINELLFVIILFNSILLLFVQNLFNINIYNILFKSSIVICLIISLIANKWRLIKKQDAIIFIIMLILFLVDYFFRRNSLTIDIYKDFIKLCFIPCYFFSRVKNYNITFKYMSLFAKISVLMYVFDALFNYYFTVNYMCYGFGPMLPSLFSIYIYYLINRNKTDLLYLLISAVAIVIYSNRTCLLSIICLVVATITYLFSDKKCNKTSAKKTLINCIVMLLLFAISFACNYLYHSKILNFKDGSITIDNNDDNTEIDIVEKDDLSYQNGDNISFDSYAINKYKEGFDDVEVVLSGRIKIYKKALKVIKKDVWKSPLTILLGKGSGYFRSINKNVYTHNIFLDLIIEYGLIGTFIMIFILCCCVYKLLVNRKDKDIYLMGCMFLFLAFPKLLLSTVFQKEHCLWLFILLVLSHYPLKFKKSFEKKEKNNESMKVCHVTSSHSRYDGRIFEKECSSLAKKYDVTLLCADLLDDETVNNVQIKSIGIDNKSRRNRFFVIPKKISKAALKIDADIYHIHDPELISLVGLLKRKGKKVVFDSHEDNVNRIDDRKWIPKVLKPIVKIMYKRRESRNLVMADAVITVADYICDRLSRINQNVYIITNFPILDDYEKIKKPKDKIICFAGGVEEKYMHHNIISALHDLDVSYYVAGPYSQNYFNRLSKLDEFDKVKMFGKISKEECNKLYLQSFAGVVLIDYVPNINYKKGSIGITKIFEYMQYGLPVIATDLDVWKEIVPGKCGICVNPNNIDEIHDAIKYLIDNPNKAKQMGINGKRLVMEKYNWNTQEKILFEIYEKIKR